MAIAGLPLGILKRMIRRNLELDISGAKTLARFRELGYRVANETFYALRREIIASTPLRFAKAFPDLEKVIPVHRHVKSLENFPTSYKYVLEVEAKSLLSAEKYTFTTALYEKERLTPEQIRERVEKYFTNYLELEPEQDKRGRSLLYQGAFEDILTIQLFRR